jgi:hypothetical protein
VLGNFLDLLFESQDFLVGLVQGFFGFLPFLEVFFGVFFPFFGFLRRGLEGSTKGY